MLYIHYYFALFFRFNTSCIDKSVYSAIISTENLDFNNFIVKSFFASALPLTSSNFMNSALARSSL
ncbi:hypothetical protein OTSKARP_0676 [Orientia tsutsugamushi str. Karp]|nr:hypothetical protein OTSKARP_0676 [Orientia tsutsugamushi str. Karp]